MEFFASADFEVAIIDVAADRVTFIGPRRTSSVWKILQFSLKNDSENLLILEQGTFL